MSKRHVHQASNTTPPPASITQHPLTPPPSEPKTRTVVEDILHEIDNRKGGRASDSKFWSRYILSAPSYAELEELLEDDDSVKDKIRSGYFPSANLFVLRMPSTLHETIISSIVGDIEQQLRAKASGLGSVAEFAQSIRSSGSASIRFPDPDFGRQDPDASFKHLKAQYPGVVFEVPYSQKRRDLQRIADNYILGSDGNIRLVVGIDVDYRGKCATLSIWRPGFQVTDAGEKELVARKTVSNQEFRDKEGNAIGDIQAGLRVRLEDFAPQMLIPKQASLDTDLYISCETLCGYLRDAELSESTSKPNGGISETLPSGVKKRRRLSTPPEQLNTDDEHQFEELENRAVKRSNRNDSWYQPG